MDIYISKGSGEGPTVLSAFDTALIDVNIANYNLIYLSSVIPTGSKLTVGKPPTKKKEWGHKLHIVKAKQDEVVAGNEAWAGIGWTQSKDTGEGLFVEHHGHSKDEVIRLINSTLHHMIKNRDIKFGDIQYEVNGILCQEKPVCSLVVAVYGSESWDR